MSGDPFVVHRSLLFTVAYEILGSAVEAEDVVQESWLRWAGVDQTKVHDSRSYLVRIVTRRSLNRLRTLARRREEYVGEWLPEPLITAPDVAEDIELAENVSIAMLTVLETLRPTERVVFVLREVFDVPYDEIAGVLEKTPAAVRKIADRARDHVAARRPRMQVDRAVQEQALEQFMEAARTGEVDALLDVLAPDVVMLSDGGGIAAAALRPIEGADKVAAFLLGLVRIARELSATVVSVNGAPALVLDVPGQSATVMTLTVAEGRITGIYAMRNPHKLGHLARETTLAR